VTLRMYFLYFGMIFTKVVLVKVMKLLYNTVFFYFSNLTIQQT